jgi:transposase InsO family protein
LGHVNVRRIMAMARDGRIDGLSQVSASEVNGFECSYCIMGKGKRQPSPRSVIRATGPLAVVHIDLWGPTTVVSSGGAKYFLTCYDDFTRKINLTFLKAKSEAFVAMKQYIAKVDNVIKTIRSDNGGEFTSKQWEQHMLQQGIQHVKVPPDAHAQNGRVERVHLTVLDDVRTLLLNSGLPVKYWAEAANYAACTRNHTPSDNKQTPLDLWTGSNTTVDHLYTFGCKLFFRDHRQTSKLQPRDKEERLLGYVDGSHTHRRLDNTSSRVIATRDVVFASEPDFANATLQDVEFGLCKTQKLRFASVPDMLDDTEEQPSVANPPVQEKVQARNDIPRRSVRLEDQRLQDAPQLQPEMQQDNDVASDTSDESDDPLLLQPHGNICAMLAPAGNINATT